MSVTINLLMGCQILVIIHVNNLEKIFRCYGAKLYIIPFLYDAKTKQCLDGLLTCLFVLLLTWLWFLTFERLFFFFGMYSQRDDLKKRRRNKKWLFINFDAFTQKFLISSAPLTNTWVSLIHLNNNNFYYEMKCNNMSHIKWCSSLSQLFFCWLYIKMCASVGLWCCFMYTFHMHITTN